VALIVLEIPEEVNAVAPLVLEMLETVQKQVERGRIGASADFADFERLLADKVSAVERAALGVALGALDVDFPKVLVDGVLHACPWIRAPRAAPLLLAAHAAAQRLLRARNARPQGRRRAGQGRVVHDARAACARLEASRDRIDSHRLRCTRGWRTAADADAETPLWSCSGAPSCPVATSTTWPPARSSRP
jgi:hypothetical protein